MQPATDTVSGDESLPCPNCDGLCVVEVGDGPDAHDVPCPECQPTAQDYADERADYIFDQRRDDAMDERVAA